MAKRGNSFIGCIWSKVRILAEIQRRKAGKNARKVAKYFQIESSAKPA